LLPQDPTFFMQVPLQVLAERGIASFLANSTVAGGEAAPAQFDWSVATSMFAHPTTNSINVLGKSIGGFVFAANLFSFVLIVSGAGYGGGACKCGCLWVWVGLWLVSGPDNCTAFGTAVDGAGWSATYVPALHSLLHPLMVVDVRAVPWCTDMA
jgi:hypothetical protein